MAYTRHVWLANAVCYIITLAHFLREICCVQIVMTVTTAVLCYAATPRTPQEHVAAKSVSLTAHMCVKFETYILWCLCCHV